MFIVNFREYIDCLRDLFADGQAEALAAYVRDMAESGAKQRAAKKKLQKEIALITAKINQLRQEIAAAEDKTLVSAEIKRQKAAKSDLVRKIRQQAQSTRFAMLSDNSKAALCTLNILRRHLTRELLENQFSGLQRDINGNVLFERETFENSFLYQDARHIYDYVTAYIAQNPGLVTTESHFNKLFNKESGWRGICHRADTFFEEQSKAKKKKSRAEIIAESCSDLEVVRKYTEPELLLVRLKTPEALDYEGMAAHNCVGGGSYDKLLSQDKSGIYSLRQMSKDGELKPVVTIELKNGEVKQVKGQCNSIVAYEYELAARDAVLRLMNIESIQELVDNENFRETELNALGIFRDNRGGYLDIHNLTGDEDFELPQLSVFAEGLAGYDWQKLKVCSVIIHNGLRAKDAHYINQFIYAKQINVKNMTEDCVLDVSPLKDLKQLAIITAPDVKCRLIGDNGQELGVSFNGGHLELDGRQKLNIGRYSGRLEGDLSAVTEISNYSGEEPNWVGLSQLRRLGIYGQDVREWNIPAQMCIDCNICTINEAILRHIVRQNIKNSSVNNHLVGDVIDLSDMENLDFSSVSKVSAKELRFSDCWESLKIDACTFSDDLKIYGLQNLKHLSLSGVEDVKKFFTAVDPLKIETLTYYPGFMFDGYYDISVFKNLKKLKVADWDIQSIPVGVEDLSLILDGLHLADIDKSAEYLKLDFSHLKNVKNLTVHSFGPPTTDIRFPEDIETLDLGNVFQQIRELDLHYCKHLRNLRMSFLAQKLERVRLPAGLEHLEARGCVNGVGVYDGSDKKDRKVHFEIPQNAKPEIIEYLHGEWGEKNVHIVPAQEKMPIAVLVQKAKNCRK